MQEKKYDVFGIGNALMDTLIKADEEDLKHLNLKKGNMTLIDDSQIDKILDYLKDKEKKEQAGGSVSNTTAGIVNLGGKAFFTGKIGRDEVGFNYENMTIKQGVSCDIKKDNNIATGNAITLITKDSERTFATYLGSAIKFTEKDINKEELLKSKILHLEGYMLEDPTLKKASLYAMDIAKKNNIEISADLSDPSLIERNLEEFKKIVEKYIDILFLNENESKAFTNINDEEKALEHLSKIVKLPIIKLGEKGSIISVKNKTLRFRSFKPKKVVDTTGAGDMYAAGILYGITNGLSLEKAGKIASYAATKVIEQTGARLDYKLDISMIN